MKSARWIGGLLAVWMASPVFAHHSPVVFDQTKEVTLVGVVTEFRWTNPHSWIALDVPNGEGGVDGWDVELTGPSYLVRSGWKSTTVKPGDEVTIIVNPLRTNENVGKFVSVTFANGEKLTERASPSITP